MEFIKGPLGSHRNYINHIVLKNCTDYFIVQKGNLEHKNIHASSRYEELRHFLNAIESMNNVIDYFYYENEESISYSNLFDFKKAVNEKYPITLKIADLANAYKHCIREGKKGKNSNKLWAKDLQKPSLVVNVNLSDVNKLNVNAEYRFEWPIEKYEEVITEGFNFYMKYDNPDGPDFYSV